MTNFTKELESGYHRETLSIDKLNDSIEVSIKGKGFFITLYLFQNDKLICQITANKETSRIITTDPLTTSRACLPLDPDSEIRVEYGLFRFSEEPVILHIKNAENLEVYADEVDIYEDVTLEEGERWYAGDFHTHTYYSDGKLSREENIVVANSRDLDFFAPTEHNVFHKTWPKSNLLIIPGMELTGDLGHFNILFSEISALEEGELFDMMEESAYDKLLIKYSDFGIVSLNHPFLVPWEFKLGQYDLSKIKTMEIINDPTYHDNDEATEKALKAWSLMLNDGYRVVGIGGSDSHNIPEETYETSLYPSLIGDPKTWVYAKSLSQKDLKEAILAGKVCVSRENVIELSQNGKEFYAEVYRKDYHKSKLKIQWIVDGKIVRECHSNADSFEYDPGKDYSWLRVDVRTEENLLFGFTNPIFFNEKDGHDLKVWKDILDHIDG